MNFTTDDHNQKIQNYTYSRRANHFILNQKISNNNIKLNVLQQNNQNFNQTQKKEIIENQIELIQYEEQNNEQVKQVQILQKKQSENEQSIKSNNDFNEKKISLKGLQKKKISENVEQYYEKKFYFNTVNEQKKNQTIPYQAISSLMQIIPNHSLIKKNQIQKYQIPTIKNKKSQWKTFTNIIQIKKYIFGSSQTKLPKSWVQGIYFTNHNQTKFGLKQNQGGPCGLIASIQCYLLKHLFYIFKYVFFYNQNQNNLTKEQRQKALIGAISQLFYNCLSKKNILILVRKSGGILSSNQNQVVQLQRTQYAQFKVISFQNIYTILYQFKEQYIGEKGSGVALLLYSLILTKSIKEIKQEMDNPELPLLGLHGHCSQQLVNLFLTGKAITNVFDGKKQIQNNFTMYGIQNKSQFGFLTIYEHFKYLQVGNNLKNPIFPIWVISKQYHYSVLFATDYRISQNKASKFDVIFYDGLYNSNQRIRLTVEVLKEQIINIYGKTKQIQQKKQLPMIELVMRTKWGMIKVDWNGRMPIL